MDRLPDISDLTDAVRAASQVLANTTTGLKNQALKAITTAIVERSEEILRADESDLAQGRDNRISGGLLDRLTLTPEHTEATVNSVHEVETLPDPVGGVIRDTRNKLGLHVTQLRMPMEVTGMVYEARPNVTIGAAVLAPETGNAVILRGGNTTQESNKAIIGVMHEALVSLEFPTNLTQSVDSFGHAGVTAMMKTRGGIDVPIPRGDVDLIRATVENSIVPVIETGTGNCHVYVNLGIDLEAAEKIIMNAKAQCVGVCNAVETLLVHVDEAEASCSNTLRQLATAGVTLHLNEHVMSVASASGAIPAKYLRPVVEDGWTREFLPMGLVVRVAGSIDEALEHIYGYLSGHTEAICTCSLASVNRFRTELDSAVVAINASTRLTGGGQVGLGTEVEISTQKLRAHGPMGLSELTISTWIIEREGTIRP